MKRDKKKHTRASLNLYLVAGLYLCYTAYSLLSEWNEREANDKVMVAIAATVFIVSAVGITVYAVKGLIAMNKGSGDVIEEIDEKTDEKKR